jgi:phage minor structural protein
MDMIRVYDATEREFNHNGIKALHPLFAEVTKVDNDDYYVELEDILDNLEYYQKGLIVRVPTPWGMQGFRCDNPEIKNNRVTCKAWHLTYDAENYLIKDSNVVEKNCNDALNHLNDATDIPSPFTVSSDITELVSTRAVRLTLFEVFERFVSADKYGGHWERDNFNFSIRANIGQDRGVVLAHNKNITDISVSEDWDNVCTKILPYTTANKVAVLLDETYVELDEQLYDIPYTKIIKFENPYDEDEFETEEEYIATTKEWLKAQADAYLQANKVPLVNYSVSAEISNVSDVGDLIYVKHPRVNVNITTNVISVKYDAIKKKYKNIEFGNFKKEIKNLKGDIVSEVEKDTTEKVEETKVLLQDELAEVTEKFNSVLGNSYVIYDGNQILVLDKLPKEEALYCIKINSAGIGFSSTGINGTFNSAWSIDGTLNMQNINVLNLTASLIKGGTLKLGGTNNASGTFELYDATNNLMALMDRTGLTVYATNGDYVKLNAEVGFAGFDKNDNKIYWADGDVFRMKNAEVENEIKIAGKIKIVPVSTSSNVGVGFVALA